MAIVETAEVKQFLQMTDDLKDPLINALIPIVEADYLKLRAAPFDTNAAGEPVYPEGAKYTAAMMIEYKIRAIGKTGISSESLGDYSVAYRGELYRRASSYPKEIISDIERYARVR